LSWNIIILLTNVHEYLFSGTPMTGEAAARVQSSEARQGGGGAEKGGFASRAQAAAEKNK
jgi:Seed maturation protein